MTRGGLGSEIDPGIYNTPGHFFSRDTHHKPDNDNFAPKITLTKLTYLVSVRNDKSIQKDWHSNVRYNIIII